MHKKSTINIICALFSVLLCKNPKFSIIICNFSLNGEEQRAHSAKRHLLCSTEESPTGLSQLCRLHRVRSQDQAIFSISSTSRSFSLGFPRDLPLFSSSALIFSHCGKSTVLTPVDTHDPVMNSF